MADVFAFYSQFDATQPDGRLVALAAAPGVDARSITIVSLPRRGGHGHHVVQWTQDDRGRSEEGHTLATALRAAVRAAGPRSASASPASDPTGSGAGSIFRETA